METENFTRSVLAWYDGGHRDLPWRRTKDAYRIWISEIMLQQTRAETVISYHVLKDIVWCAAQFFKVSICVRNTISRFRKAYAIYSTIPSKNWLTSTDNALFKF